MFALWNVNTIMHNAENWLKKFLNAWHLLFLKAWCGVQFFSSWVISYCADSYMCLLGLCSRGSNEVTWGLVAFINQLMMLLKNWLYPGHDIISVTHNAWWNVKSLKKERFFFKLNFCVSFIVVYLYESHPPRFITQGEQRLFYYRYTLSVVFNQGYFCHPGNIWQCLDIFLVVTPGEWVLLVSNGWRPGIMTYIAQDSLYHKELSSLKCQFCQHRKTLLYIRFKSFCNFDIVSSYIFASL